MALDPAADQAMAARLARAGVTDGDELIVLHVSAGNPFRRWPEASLRGDRRGTGVGKPAAAAGVQFRAVGP